MTGASTGIGREAADLVAFPASDVVANMHGEHVPVDGARRKALLER